MDDAKELSKKALTLAQLEVGKEVTLLHDYFPMTDEWVKPHTGTIKAINKLEGLIEFDFPKKELDKTPVIPMHRFTFEQITNDDDKRLFLVEAMEPATVQDTAFTQQSMRNRFTVS
ncbi:MAG TPA: hypothetical protein VIM37_00580 [Candidatus Microsaccharimonas sp.]|jgi:hypothetical protein